MCGVNEEVGEVLQESTPGYQQYDLVLGRKGHFAPLCCTRVSAYVYGGTLIPVSGPSLHSKSSFHPLHEFYRLPPLRRVRHEEELQKFKSPHL